MSTGYNVLPLQDMLVGEENVLDEEGAASLRQLGLVVPDRLEPAHPLTPAAFHETLAAWEGCELGEAWKGDELTLWVTARDASDATIAFVRDYSIDHAG